MTDYSSVVPVRSDHTTERRRNILRLLDATARRTLLASIIVTVHRDDNERLQRCCRPPGVLQLTDG